MRYLAVIGWDQNFRVTKFKDFADAAAALAHAATYGGFVVSDFPVTADPAEWIADTVAGTLTLDPPPVVKPTVIAYEAFQDRFTTVEFDAITDFVEEVDLTMGKPKRRALKQGMARVYAKGTVDLLAARTDAFLTALVNGGVLTAARKMEVMTP